MGWKCPKCNAVHPYSVKKCPCGDTSSSSKKASPPTRTGEDQERGTLDLELADEGEETAASREESMHLEAPTELEELKNDLNTLGQEDETSLRTYEHLEGLTESDVEDLSLEKPEDDAEIGGVDMNCGKEGAKDVSMRNRTSLSFERLVFMITRVLALCGAVVVLAGIVFLAVNLLSGGTKDIVVTYNDIEGELNVTNAGEESDEGSEPPRPSVQVAIPNNLQRFFSGKNAQVLQNWLRPLSQSQKRDFLNNLSVVYAEVQRKSKGNEEIQIQFVNRYANLKLAKLNQNEFDKYAAVATKAGYLAGIFGLLLILSILSLVLVLLAIERNTRPNSVISNRQNV